MKCLIKTFYCSRKRLTCREAGVGMRLVREHLLQLHQTPAVILEVLLVLRVHRVDLAFRCRLREERAEEELREAIQSAFQMLRREEFGKLLL